MWSPLTVVETHRDYVLAAWACRVLQANGLRPALQTRRVGCSGWIHDVVVLADETVLATQVLEAFAETEVPSFFRAEAESAWSRQLQERDRRSG
jgi:hypothetical protein